MKISQLFKEKGVEADPDKTCYIVFGAKEYRAKIDWELKDNPLCLGDFPVQRRESDRYLGQILHSEGYKG